MQKMNLHIEELLRPRHVVISSLIYLCYFTWLQFWATGVNFLCLHLQPDHSWWVLIPTLETLSGSVLESWCWCWKQQLCGSKGLSEPPRTATLMSKYPQKMCFWKRILRKFMGMRHHISFSSDIKDFMSEHWRTTLNEIPTDLEEIKFKSTLKKLIKLINNIQDCSEFRVSPIYGS